MKAHKFVAEFGIEKAKEVLEGAPLKTDPTWYFFVCEECGCGGSSEKLTTDSYVCDYVACPECGAEDFNDEWNSHDELKQVVESVELIYCFDDLEQARSWVPEMDNNEPYIFNGDTYDNKFYRHELEQAIADYEAVESCKSSNDQAISHSCVSDLSKNESQNNLSIKQDAQIFDVIESIIARSLDNPEIQELCGQLLDLIEGNQ